MTQHETINDNFVLFYKGVFSQWYPSIFVHDNTKYVTVEHWMMAAKARLFHDDLTLKKILDTKSPKEAKDLGRQVKGFNPNVWDAKCFDIVVQGNYLKFSQNSDMKEYLLGTGTKILVEASPYDTIWGIGIGQDDERAFNPGLWRGKNLLGMSLMAVRSKFGIEK